MRRDTLEKETVTCDGIETYVQKLLEEIQANIYKKALDYRNSKITTVDTYEEFKEKIEKKAALSWLIGTEQPTLKKRLKRIQKQRFVVSHSIRTLKVIKNRENVW